MRESSPPYGSPLFGFFPALRAPVSQRSGHREGFSKPAAPFLCLRGVLVKEPGPSASRAACGTSVRGGFISRRASISGSGKTLQARPPF
ncbi:hypothetical protein NDU88_004170 [Pleurodeles waltl]|uniref:Uncharacterized protein n=1 Tax=Pleurodeles waltl TaxID=8319 RepID=A0AAV7KXK4_PLEWA|nr:hypothetical protein NDU88_004170 [Pleurodeles waltl]